MFAVIATCCGCGKGDSGDCLQRLLVREEIKGKRARDATVDELQGRCRYRQGSGRSREEGRTRRKSLGVIAREKARNTKRRTSKLTSIARTDEAFQKEAIDLVAPTKITHAKFIQTTFEITMTSSLPIGKQKSRTSWTEAHKASRVDLACLRPVSRRTPQSPVRRLPN